MSPEQCQVKIWNPWSGHHAVQYEHLDLLSAASHLPSSHTLNSSALRLHFKNCFLIAFQILSSVTLFIYLIHVLKLYLKRITRKSEPRGRNVKNFWHITRILLHNSIVLLAFCLKGYWIINQVRQIKFLFSITLKRRKTSKGSIPPYVPERSWLWSNFFPVH